MTAPHTHPSAVRRGQMSRERAFAAGGLDIRPSSSSSPSLQRQQQQDYYSSHASDPSGLASAGPSIVSPTAAPVLPSRERQSALKTESSVPSSSAAASSTSPFRNVSACKRCRSRKNRCDFNLPACYGCRKAGEVCVGYDPFLDREIPRSYVFYLERRNQYLEGLLDKHGVAFDSAEHSIRSQRLATSPAPNAAEGYRAQSDDNQEESATMAVELEHEHNEDEALDEQKVRRLASDVGMIAVQGASDSRFLGSSSGIAFVRLAFDTVKDTVIGSSSSDNEAAPASNKDSKAEDASMRDSVFGLRARSRYKSAQFPSQDLGRKLVDLYFEYANPQIPILHRGEFMTLFQRVYEKEGHVRSPRETYLLNIVFAIGAGIKLAQPEGDSTSDQMEGSGQRRGSAAPAKRARLEGHKFQPEEYHAAAVAHLEHFLSSNDRPDGFGGGLEELQGVLLLASFALLRPVAPGLWYIVGVALRLALDLGLHLDECGSNMAGSKAETPDTEESIASQSASGVEEKDAGLRTRGEREWKLDLRRRLFWCTYAFDRLVSTCVGRPFGISDRDITTKFPSLLDDKYIQPTGFCPPKSGMKMPSYKVVAHHYFRLRVLQSEIVSVLQQSRNARQILRRQSPDLQSSIDWTLEKPFPSKFSTFSEWRMDIDRRLRQWKDNAPLQSEAGVKFRPEFLELNYWQAIMMLYWQSLGTPAEFSSEIQNLAGDAANAFNNSDAHDMTVDEGVYMKLSNAGRTILRLYKELNARHLVNFTYLATQHIFMAGIAHLYAIWCSKHLRSSQDIDEIKNTILGGMTVLMDLTPLCPPAKACGDVLNRMCKATIHRCMNKNLRISRPRTHSRSGVEAAQERRTRGPSLTKPKAPSFQSSNTQDRTEVGSTLIDGHYRPLLPDFDYDLRGLLAADQSQPTARQSEPADLQFQLQPSMMPPHLNSGFEPFPIPRSVTEQMNNYNNDNDISFPTSLEFDDMQQSPYSPSQTEMPPKPFSPQNSSMMLGTFNETANTPSTVSLDMNLEPSDTNLLSGMIGMGGSHDIDMGENPNWLNSFFFTGYSGN